MRVKGFTLIGWLCPAGCLRAVSTTALSSRTHTSLAVSIPLNPLVEEPLRSQGHRTRGAGSVVTLAAGIGPLLSLRYSNNLNKVTLTVIVVVILNCHFVCKACARFRLYTGFIYI